MTHRAPLSAQKSTEELITFVLCKSDAKLSIFLMISYFSFFPQNQGQTKYDLLSQKCLTKASISLFIAWTIENFVERKTRPFAN